MAPEAWNDNKEGARGFEDLVTEHRVMRTVARSRVAASAVVAGATWAFGRFHAPFTTSNELVMLVADSTPHVAEVLHLAHTVMCFITPSMFGFFVM